MDSAAGAHLVSMVNQIARNFSYLPEEAAAEQVAAHLRRFWAPAMLARLREVADTAPEALEPVVHRAVASIG